MRLFPSRRIPTHSHTHPAGRGLPRPDVPPGSIADPVGRLRAAQRRSPER